MATAIQAYLELERRGALSPVEQERLDIARRKGYVDEHQERDLSGPGVARAISRGARKLGQTTGGFGDEFAMGFGAELAGTKNYIGDKVVGLTSAGLGYLTGNRLGNMKKTLRLTQ